MKMRTIICFGDRTSGTFPIIAGLLDEDNSVSRTDNFVNAIVFNGVTYIFSCTHLPEIETLQEKKN